jgi:hypothetical protein
MKSGRLEKAAPTPAPAKKEKKPVSTLAANVSKKAAAAAKKAIQNTGGPGVKQDATLANPADSAEADAILALVTKDGGLTHHPESGRFVAAKSVMDNPKASAAAKAIAINVMDQIVKGVVAYGGSNNSGDVTPAATGSLSSSPGALRSDLGTLAKQLEEATDPAIKAELGQRLTYARLRAYHEGLASKSDGLAAAAAELVARDQNSAREGKAATGTSGGALIPDRGDPRAQTGSLGVAPASLGSPGGKPGTSRAGYLVGEELVALKAQLADVQARTKAGSITEQERHLREQIVMKELAAKHGG